MYLTILVTILGSAGVFSFIEYLITRRDKRTGMLAEIKKEIDELKVLRLHDRATRYKSEHSTPENGGIRLSRTSRSTRSTACPTPIMRTTRQR